MACAFVLGCDGGGHRAVPFVGTSRRRALRQQRPGEAPAVRLHCRVDQQLLEEVALCPAAADKPQGRAVRQQRRSEEHTSELQSLMRISYAVFCLTQKTKKQITTTNIQIYT